MKTDHYLYRLFSHCPEALFELTGQRAPQCDYRLHAEEVKQTNLRLDGILIPDNSEAPLLFLENQLYLDSDFYARWFASIMLRFKQKRSGTLWQAVVIYPDSRFDAGLDTEDQLFEQAGVLHRLYLEEILIQAESQTEANRSADTLFILRLLSLLRIDAAEQLQLGQQAQNLLQHFIPTPKINRIDAIDFIETLLVYKLPDLSREEIRAMLQIPTTDLRHTRFFKEVYDEGLSKGISQGFSQGISQGEVKGHNQGLQAAIFRQLQRRFGELNQAQRQAIEALTAAQLETLTEALLDFSDINELNDWLGQQSL
ncbi:DUF2887 domain-containing protein [Ectothiorhodospiraceae bacterium BW-2]|nr:DUF2887 domain-containing protein [Ectothiorhodospiraceae bacterium BW-2]